MNGESARKFNGMPAWKHGVANMLIPELSDILADVIIERVEQIDQWGGPDTDDNRRLDQWSEYIHRQLSYLMTEQDTPSNVRQRFVKVAALAFAAIEALDRKHAIPAQCACGGCQLDRALSGAGDGSVVFAGTLDDLLGVLSGLRKPPKPPSG